MASRPALSTVQVDSSEILEKVKTPTVRVNKIHFGREKVGSLTHRESKSIAVIRPVLNPKRAD